MTAAPTESQSSIHRLPRRCANWLLWLLITAFLIVGGYWAFYAGLSLREQLWQESGTIRYHADIRLAFYWGNRVLRYAERRAGLPNRADALAGNPKAAEDPELSKMPTRRLTNAELLDGWVHFYGWLIDRADDGQFDLDYPPMRLGLMTLWARHAQREHPALKQWPMQGYYSPPQPIQTYDFAKPLLLINSGCAAAAAIAGMGLCWLWTARHENWRRRQHVCDPAAPLIPHGLLTFMVSASAFWYAWSLAAQPPPPPTPRICLQFPTVDGHRTQLHGVIDAEGIQTMWRFQWGATQDYTHRSRWIYLLGNPDVARPASLSVMQSPQQPFHYRLQARNINGVTSTEDQLYVPAGVETKQTTPRLAMSEPISGGFAVGGVGQWIWLSLLLIIMLVSAGMLPPVHRGWACGSVAAMFIWFDPTILAVSHIWPQWDVWLLAFFIWAALAASLGIWEMAGLLLGIGVMFKGQMLMGVPILTLWPIFAGKPLAALRLLIGLACGAAIIVWPWMLNDPHPARWITGWILIPPLSAVLLVALKSIWRPRSSAAPRLIRWCRSMHLAATLAMAGFAAGVFISGFFYKGDFSWYTVGFAYGANKQDKMAMGAGSFANLPVLLKDKFGWQLHDVVGTITFPLGDHLRHLLGLPVDGFDLPLRTLLIALNALCVIASAAAAAVHSRRRDPRTLVALCVPWMIMPICLGQMSERYLLWACALSSVLLCISAGWGLFHVLLTLLAAGMTLHQLLDADPGRWPHLYDFFTVFYEEGSMLMTLLAAILLVGAFIPGPREKSLC